MRILRPVCAWVGIAALVVACTNRPQQQADRLYVNARIYTVDDKAGWAEAMAVRDGRIIAIGEARAVGRHRGKGTEVVDLGGRMVMPGIHDSHIHPLDGGVQQLLECRFPPNSLDAALAKIEECVKQAKPGAWVRGGQWSHAFFEGKGPLPRELLDRIAPDNPVFLMDWSAHNAWVNTRALEAFGIDRRTADPVGGTIMRVPGSGRETGVLLDNAAYSYQARLPEYPLGELARALDFSLRQVEEQGITTIKDAIVTPEIMRVYQELSRRNALRIHVKTSLTWKSAWAKSHDGEIRQIEGRAAFATDRIDPDFVKIMLDGVLLQYTSALLTPYPPNDRIGAHHTGDLMLRPDELARDVVALDRQGLSIKIHATGDRAARVALDAFAAARRENGDSGIIHEIAHAGLVHPDDIPRFRQLNVAAEMCPIVWYPMPGIDRAAIVGKERMPAWRINTLYRAGALVSYGSDWPVVPTASPWPGIEAMVTRMDPYGRSDRVDSPGEAVDLPTAIRIFTRNGALVNKVPDSSGSLEAGKDADFIVLDRNLFEVPITEVGDVQVLMSVVGGKVLFDKRASSTGADRGDADESQ